MYKPLSPPILMSPQAGFMLQTEILPRLISAIPQAVSFIGSEDAQELVQDGTLIAAQMIHNAERAGKKVVRNPGPGREGARKVRTISAGNVAFYTIQKLKCGRRSTGSSTVDVYGSGTQINGTTRLTSLDEAAPMTGVDDVGEPLLLHDVLSRDEDDPGTKAARTMDWDSVMAGLSARDRGIINCLVEGKPLASLARRRHLNNGHHFEGAGMNNCRLERIQDWPQRAHDAKFSVKALAKSCGVSVRALERFFVAVFGCKPRQWLKTLRMQKAIKLRREGSNVNETADHLGYHDRSHFSREFKSTYGLAPRNTQPHRRKLLQLRSRRIRPHNCRIWPQKRDCPFSWQLAN